MKNLSRKSQKSGSFSPKKGPFFAYFESRTQKKGKGGKLGFSSISQLQSGSFLLLYLTWPNLGGSGDSTAKHSHAQPCIAINSSPKKGPFLAYFESRTQKKGKGALISAPSPFDTCNIKNLGGSGDSIAMHSQRKMKNLSRKSEESGSFSPKIGSFSPKIGPFLPKKGPFLPKKGPFFAYFESRTQKKGKRALISAPFPLNTCNIFTIFIRSEESGLFSPKKDSFSPKKDPFSPSIANQRHPLWTFGPGSQKYLEIFAIFPVFMAGTCTFFRPRCLHRLPELVINAKRGEDLLFQAFSPNAPFIGRLV